MTSTERQRRRNMRPGSCRVCGTPVATEAGWLYRDTHGQRNRYTGKFGWLVKCDGCHADNKTRGTLAAERERANAKPAPKRWTVSQVKTWTVERGEHEGDVAVWVSGSFGREVVSFRDPINSRFSGYTGYGLECLEIAGRYLSDAAAGELSSRILAAIVAVQHEETQAEQAAVAKLVAAGATIEPMACGHGLHVDLAGKRYFLWGCVGGKHILRGPVDTFPWVDTTAEQLLGQ